MYIEGLPLLKKKVLTLDSINQQIKSGQRLFVTDDKCNTTEIKQAAALGLIKLIGAEETIEKPISKLKIQCVNVSRRPINLLIINATVAVGQKFHLTEHEILDNSVRTSISNGLIRVLGATDNNLKNIAPTNIRLRSLLPEEIFTKPENAEVPKPSVKEKAQTEETEEKVQWNPSSSKPIATKKKVSKKTPAKSTKKKNNEEIVEFKEATGNAEMNTKDSPATVFDPNKQLSKQNSKTATFMTKKDGNVKFASTDTLPMENVIDVEKEKTPQMPSKAPEIDNDRPTMFDPHANTRNKPKEPFAFMQAPENPEPKPQPKNIQQNGEIEIAGG